MKSTNANDGTLDAQGVVRGRVEPGHGQRAHAEPRVTGPAADAAVGQELRRHGEEGAGVSAARHLDQVAQRHLRQQLPVELHDDQRQRRDRAHPRRRSDQPVRRQRLRDARLAAARRHRPARPDRPGHRERHRPAEPVDPGRPDRRTARGEGHRVHLHRSYAGPPAERGGIRQHHHPDQSRTGREVPAEGRRPARARARCSTTPSGATTASRPRSSPCSRFPGTNALDVAKNDQGRDGEPVEALPARHGVPGLARHDAAGVGGHQRDRAHAASKPSRS